MPTDTVNGTTPHAIGARENGATGAPIRQDGLSALDVLAAIKVLAVTTARGKLSYGFRSGTLAIGASTLAQAVFMLVWLSVMTGRPERIGDELFLRRYLVAALGLNTALALSVEARCWQRISRGMISLELLRPISFQTYQLAQAGGDVLVNTLYAVPAYFLGWALLGAAGWPGAGRCAAVACSVVLAFLITFGISYVFVLGAFVTQSSYGLMNARLSMHQVFSGCAAPLYMFPQQLRTVARHLPFRHVVETPVLIALGELTPRAVAELLLQQLGWAAFLLLTGALAFRQVIRRQQLNGG